MKLVRMGREERCHHVFPFKFLRGWNLRLHVPEPASVRNSTACDRSDVVLQRFRAAVQVGRVPVCCHQSVDNTFHVCHGGAFLAV
jgi:hypothetical protein